MKVKELIKLLEQLDQEKEIRYDSYEFVGDFSIEEGVLLKNEGGEEYYCIE
jgi:hypothetical protein